MIQLVHPVIGLVSPPEIYAVNRNMLHQDRTLEVTKIVNEVLDRVNQPNVL